MSKNEEPGWAIPLYEAANVVAEEYYRALGDTDQMPKPVLKSVQNSKDTSFEDALQHKYQELKDLLLRKHADYGPNNIAMAPGGPLNGLRVRMWDKQARISHLMDHAKKPDNESLRDSFLDLANYAVIGLMVLDGDWPEK